VFFTAYFLAHDLRDEAFFYEANGDVPPTARVRRPGRVAITLATAALVATLGVAVCFGIGGARRYQGALADLPAAARAAIAAAIVVLAFLGTRAVARAEGLVSRAHWRAYFREHRPIVLVAAGAYGALFVGLWITGRFYVIVSLHIVLWWVFAGRNLAKAPAPSPRPRPLTWAWVRRTPLGFHAFHGAVLAAIVLAAAVYALAYRNDASVRPLYWLTGKDCFYYWTLVHVTLSWIPRAV
jgi:hypothetical protein